LATSFFEGGEKMQATDGSHTSVPVIWLMLAVVIWLPAGLVHADWTYDSESYTFVLEPNLVAGDVFYQHWANEGSDPATYLHSGNMLFDTHSWYDIDPNHVLHVLHSRGDYCGSTTFADYRVRSTEGNIYALRSTTWHNAYQPNEPNLPLTLDHYNAYSPDDGFSYTDYFLHENWDGGCPPGTGWGCGGGEPLHCHNAQTVIDSPGRITRLRYGVRDLNDWDEWYGASWRVWAGSTQTEYHDNYLTDPFAESEGGPIWSCSNLSWDGNLSGTLANSDGNNPIYCTYLIAHHGAMTGIDIRLTSTDLGPAAEAIRTPNTNVHLHLAIATNEGGPYTDVYLGEEFVPNSANPGAYVDLVPYSKPEVLFVKIYSTKDAGDSYYIRWGGFHVEITAEDPPDIGPVTCEELWELTPPGYDYPGDFDNDCRVNMADLALFANSWFRCNDPLGDPCCCDETPYGLSADLNHDCTIDAKDLSTFADSWQQPCDITPPTTTDRPFREILGISGIGFRTSNIDVVTDLGATWVRYGVDWASVEMSPGVYCIPIWDRYRIDKIHEAGLNIILHLGASPYNSNYDNPYDPNAYANFAAFCVRRLRGKIQACHCINEPHNFGFSAYYGGAWNGAPPSPWVAKYAELVRLTAAAVRKVAPEIPAMADEDVVVNHYRFLDEGMGPYVSACSWHPYGGCDHFNFGWDHPSEAALPYQVADEDGSRVSLIRRLEQKGQDVTGKNFEIYGTEVGWAPDSGHPHHSVPDIQTAANYLIRSYVISYANNMKILCWYTLQDDPYSEFGLVDPNCNKRDTYYAYRNMAQTLGDLHLLRCICGQQTPTYGVQAYLFGATDEQNMLVLWSANDLDYSVNIYGIEAGARILDSLGNEVGVISTSPFNMTVGCEPNYIVEGVPDDVSIYAELGKLLADDGAADDEFGRAVSIDGDYVLVGAYLDDDHGTQSGSAYIFGRTRVGWIQQVKLTADDADVRDRFGCSVSIDGNCALVGAYENDDNGSASGSAYIFKRSDDPNDPNWYRQAKLLADDGAADDQFGRSVSLSGNYAIVGSIGDDDHGSSSGAAYIFKREGVNWTQQAKLTATDAASLDRFGISVSINGSFALIGSYWDDDNGDASGSAYIFRRSDIPGDPNWYQQAKLLPADGAANDEFGRSVSLDGDYALVGSYGDDDNGSNSGSAYIFRRDGTSWSQQAKLLPADGAANDEFGLSVSLDGDYTLVGSCGDNDNGDDSGSAYIFRRDGTSWSQQAKLLAYDGDAGDEFGLSVSSSGSFAIVGSWGDDDKGDSSGSVYIFGCPTAD
jgi:hypothetical protein